MWRPSSLSGNPAGSQLGNRVGNLAGIILCICLLSACQEPTMPSPFHAQDVSWQHPHADFQLADFNGKARRLSDFTEKNNGDGKVVVLFFGYTHCPDVCPTTLADLAQLMRLLGSDADRVQVLFITLDPERDTPQLLAKFVPSFHPTFLGLHGDAQATAQAAQSFGVSYAQQPGQRGSYTLDHTDAIFLLGLRGKPLLRARYGTSAELLAQDVRLLLALSR